MIPFRVSECNEQRAKEVSQATANLEVEMGKNPNFDPVKYLEEHLSAGKPTSEGPSCSIKGYKGPSDEITSREG